MSKSAKDYLKEPYSRVLVPLEKGVFFAEILEFPGCYAEGATPTEAFNNLEKAATNWIKATLENGQAIPEPSASPGYSGKVVLRLPKSLHRKAAQYAARDRASMNQCFTSAIAAWVGADDLYHRTAEKLAGLGRSQMNTVINVYGGFQHGFQQLNVNAVAESSRSLYRPLQIQEATENG